MKPTALLHALTMCALMTTPFAFARQAQEGPPTAQQVQKAQQDRNAAERYLQREEAAATGNRSDATGRANRDAGVADEAGDVSGDPRRAGPVGNAAAAAAASGSSGNGGSTRAGASTPPPAYGPVLGTQPPQQANPASKNPADVHDESDRPMRDPGNMPTQKPSQPSSQPQQSQRQSRRNTTRHAAMQPANEPMAPRPLRAPDALDATVAAPVPVAPPAMAPQPLTPSSTQLNSCRGGACTDANGATINGIGNGNAGVNSAGRLCTRTGATAQCL